MRLILLRHGQTPSNVHNFLDTAEPGPGLTELGRAQAAAAPAGLVDEQVAAIYASTMTRAQLTAAPLAQARGLEVRVRRGLREMSAGELEMDNSTEAILGYLGVARQWMSGQLDVRMPGADTGREVLERFDSVVREAEVDADGTQGAVVMVSHGAMIRTWSGLRAGNLDAQHPELYELSNTGAVLLEGSMEGLRNGEVGSGWTCLDWRASAIGGPDLVDSATDGPLAESGLNAAD